MSEPKDLDAPQTSPDNAQEDTDAILSRRRFLIQSGLAGAGLAVTGCDKGGKPDKAAGTDPMGKGHKPGICLKIAAPKPDAAVSQTCLSVAIMKPDKPPSPRPCLGLTRTPPKRPQMDPGKTPMKPPRKAMVCLTQPRPPRRKRPGGRPRICLSKIK